MRLKNMFCKLICQKNTPIMEQDIETGLFEDSCIIIIEQQGEENHINHINHINDMNNVRINIRIDNNWEMEEITYDSDPIYV